VLATLFPVWVLLKVMSAQCIHVLICLEIQSFSASFVCVCVHLCVSMCVWCWRYNPRDSHMPGKHSTTMLFYFVYF
jgi:protein-S-isoprenylcysteine O-methyltransferase Ste14